MKIQFFSRAAIPQKNTLLNFARKVCAVFEKQRCLGEVSVIFVTDKEIKKLNRAFLKHDRTTDVIAFNYPESKKDSPFGDIYISLDTARRQSQEGKYPLVREIALLVLHGLLHLFGYKDSTAKEKQKMTAQQKRCFQILNPRLAPPDYGS